MTRIDDASSRPRPANVPAASAPAARPEAPPPAAAPPAASRPAAAADSYGASRAPASPPAEAAAALEQRDQIRSQRRAAAGGPGFLGRIKDGLEQAGGAIGDGFDAVGEGLGKAGSEVGSSLKKVGEGAISVPMMVFGWTRELMEGSASVVRGRGTIQGPIPPELSKIDRIGVSPASVVSIDPAPAGSPAAERQKVYEAQKKAVEGIGGYDFLSQPPKGRTDNSHTVLVKPGVNWGINGYPTCTSAESTYASVRQTLEEGERRGAKVDVIVGDESGIEGKAWGATTLGNFELSGVLDGAVRAGLERAMQLEQKGDKNFAGARAVWDSLAGPSGAERKVTLEDEAAIEMARKAGVRVVGFDEVEHVRVPIPEIAPGVPGNRHFPDGLLIPKLVRDEVTDIINLPKPPGRHALMGCAGVTGGLKNAIGLVGASDRVPALHGPLDRVPGLNSGKNGDSWAAQFKELGERLKDPALSPAERLALQHKLQSQAKWDLNSERGPNWMLHEKIAEMNLVFADKQRFTVTDMRKTLSTFGPDLGETMDIGKVVASKHAATVDVLANALIKNAYEGMSREPLELIAGTLQGTDTLGEHLYGRTWLEKDATAFDTLQIRAAMAYGLAPLGREAIQLTSDGAAPQESDPLLRHVRTPG